jgi:hypothetical protein
MAAIANQRWISIHNIIIDLKTKFCPNRRIFLFWRLKMATIANQNGRHTPYKYPFPLKSFHFWIFNNLYWRPFWFCSTPQELSHYGGYSYKIAWSLMKGIQQFLKSPFFYFHGNCSKVCPTDSDFFLAYLVPLDVDVVPIKFHQFLFGE